MQPALAEAKPEITIGVLGQDGHGKTSLTTAIARARSPQDRNMVEGGETVINAGEGAVNGWLPFLYETETRRYTHIDFHRHIDVMKHMVLHHLSLQGAILVVSAVDGVTAQTREQVRLAQQTGIPSLIVFLNKCDLTNDFDLLDATETEVRELLSEHGYSADTPCSRGSATTALQRFAAERSDIWTSKIRELLDTLDTYIPVPQRMEDKPFLMSIDEEFFIPYAGTVAIGPVERGTCGINTVVEIVGFKPPRKNIVTDMEQRHKKCAMISAGEAAGLLLRSLVRGGAQRGQVLAAPGTIQAYSKFRAIVYLLTRQEEGSDFPDLSAPIYSFFIRTVEINGTLKLEEGMSQVRGGDIVPLTVELEVIVAMEVGLRFTLRKEGSPLGMGVVTEVLS